VITCVNSAWTVLNNGLGVSSGLFVHSFLAADKRTEEAYANLQEIACDIAFAFPFTCLKAPDENKVQFVQPIIPETLVVAYPDCLGSTS
jgi:hypothetical protein